MYITLKQLEKRFPNCTVQREWSNKFKRLFGSKCKVTPKNVEKWLVNPGVYLDLFWVCTIVNRKIQEKTNKATIIWSELYFVLSQITPNSDEHWGMILIMLAEYYDELEMAK